MTPTHNTQARWRVLAIAAMSALSGCQGCFGCPSPVNRPGSTLPSSCTSSQPLIEPQRVDILFVVDNSGSMHDKQVQVAKELTAFVDELHKSGGVPQDFNVGMITTSVYQLIANGQYRLYTEFPNQAGRLQPVPDGLPDGGVVRGTGTERVLNGNDPQLIEKFSRLVQAGTSGSGQETPFEAVRLAVTDLAQVPLADGGNAEFFRDGARLLIIVLTDEDDCSETGRPPKTYVTSDLSADDCLDQINLQGTVSEYHRIFAETLTDHAGRPREVLWGAIAPVGLTSNQVQLVHDGQNVARNVDCPNSFAEGLRHRQMAEMFDPTLSNLDSICRDTYRDAMLRIAQSVAVSQTLEVKDLPDEHMLQLEITRADGSTQLCTLLQGLSFEPGVNGGNPRITFKDACLRRADDKSIAFRLLCAT